MVGDVNMFLKGDHLSAASEAREGEDDVEVEVEIMIAGVCSMYPFANDAELLLRQGIPAERTCDRCNPPSADLCHRSMVALHPSPC